MLNMFDNFKLINCSFTVYRNNFRFISLEQKSYCMKKASPFVINKIYIPVISKFILKNAFYKNLFDSLLLLTLTNILKFWCFTLPWMVMRLKASAHSFKRLLAFKSIFLSLSIHPLPRMNVMLDFLKPCQSSCEEHGTSEHYKKSYPR